MLLHVQAVIARIISVSACLVTNLDGSRFGFALATKDILRKGPGNIS